MKELKSEVYLRCKMLTTTTDNSPTIAALPGGRCNNNRNYDNDDKIDYSSPPFPNKRASQGYITSISPPRDLICPITQELFSDPVVALGDGCTYERTDIQRWFEAQLASNGNGGAGSGNGQEMMIRSPVSNAFMHGENPRGVIENRVVAGLARSFREQLGRELCSRCEFVYNKSPGSSEGDWGGVLYRRVIGDGGFRIKSLVEAGADLSLKECSGGNTAFMMVRIYFGFTFQ